MLEIKLHKTRSQHSDHFNSSEALTLSKISYCSTLGPQFVVLHNTQQLATGIKKQKMEQPQN
jgi:hypothetical protein